MLSKFFPRIKAKSLTECVQSRDAFVYLDRVTRFLGWATPKDWKWAILYRVWTILTMSLIILVPSAMMAEYVYNFSSFSVGEYLSSLSICINIYGCGFKCAIIIKGYGKLEEAKRILDKLDERCIQDEEKSGVRQFVAWGNLCYLMYHISYFSFVLINFTGYIIMGRHAWRMYFPFVNAEKNFFFTNIVETLLMSSVVVMDQCTDAYALSYVLLGHCHLTLLRDRLSRLRIDPEKSADEDLMELNKCIQDHLMILDYFSVLRPIFSWSIFVQFLLIGIVLGLSMINIMFFSTFLTAIGICCFIVGVSLETFPFCHLCDVIIDDSIKLSNSLFHSNWMSADRRYKSTLIYFLHHLQQPITLTAGGVFPVGMETNLSMVKLAFSVVTFMKQLNLAEMFK